MRVCLEFGEVLHAVVVNWLGYPLSIRVAQKMDVLATAVPLITTVIHDKEEFELC